MLSRLTARGKSQLGFSPIRSTLSDRLLLGRSHHTCSSPYSRDSFPVVRSRRCSLHLATNTSPRPYQGYIPAQIQPVMQSISASPRDSTRPTPEPADSFEGLVASINKILGPSNGIDSAGVNVQDLQDAMQAYSSREADWAKYAMADPSRAYTRNLVDNCNGKSNALILVWTPGKGSPVHDHANAHCVMKVLKGTLRETLYGWPCQRSSNPASCASAAQPSDPNCPNPVHTCSAGPEPLEPAALQVQRDMAYGQDQVTYMSDKLGLHRITNPSDTEYAVSLHLYTVSEVPHMPIPSPAKLTPTSSHQTPPNGAATSSTRQRGRRATSANVASTLNSAKSYEVTD